jgi:hypothetical protein
MEDADAAQERLLGLLHQLDFPRRWYDLCVASRVGTPSRDLPVEEQAAALATTGRAFRYNRREKFYATREADVPGELGVNLSLRHGVAEFILVLRVPAGHIAGPFSGLMRAADRRFGPVLPEAIPYPQPWYQGVAELQQVLAAGFGLYAEVAGAVLVSGLLVGSAPDAEPALWPSELE